MEFENKKELKKELNEIIELAHNVSIRFII